MKHFLIMVVFSAFVASVFGLVGRDTRREGFLYSLKIFGEFIAIGFILAWLLYWLPL